MEDVKTCARENFRLVTQLPLGQARVWAAPRHRVDRARSATPLAALAKPSFGAERVPKQELGHEEQNRFLDRKISKALPGNRQRLFLRPFRPMA